MSIEKSLKDFLWRLNGSKRVLSELKLIEEEISQAVKNCGGALKKEEILPGTEYSRYAIPVDYKPSRDFFSRWGYSRGKINAIESWFESYNEEYLKFLKFMRQLHVGHISISLQADKPLAPAWVGGAICAFDALALYAMVLKYTPKVYLEVGSGMTTCFARQSIKDANLKTKIISIDPDPRREVDAICDEVIRDALETCDLSIFDRLEEGDILFFDGSHRSFMNSDVTVFFVDVLPLLKPGVIIHLHDIFLLWDYPDSFKYWYWNEQYLLAVYLMCSMDRLLPLLPTTWISRISEFENFFTTSFVDLNSPDANMSWRGGGSMWFTKKKLG